MRLSSSNEDNADLEERRNYADFILKFGEGKIKEDANGNIPIPDKYLHDGNL